MHGDGGAALKFRTNHRGHATLPARRHDGAGRVRAPTKCTNRSHSSIATLLKEAKSGVQL